MSNSPQQNEKFSLKSFKERRLAMHQKDTALIKAERVPKKSNFIDNLKALGLEVAEGKPSQSNQALTSIFQVYRHNTNSALYISPFSSWKYEDRFAVYFFQPVSNFNVPTKEEILSVVQNFHPKQLEMISAGYTQGYAYNAKPTNPNKVVYLLYCKYMKPDLFSYFMRVKNLVYTPPQLPNMLQKLRVNMSKSLPQPDPLFITKVINSSQCECKELIEILINAEKNGKTSVQAMMEVIYEAKPHTSSPSFPWVCMSKTDGTSWGSLSASNEPLMDAIFSVIERFVRMLNGSIGTTPEARGKVSVKQAYEKGKSFYQYLHNMIYQNFVLDKVLLEMKYDDKKKSMYLSPHIIFLESSGRIKPVTEEDIKNGKPDRSIFQSPAMIRLAYMFLSEQITDNWVNSSKLKHFGWQQGGTERLLNELFEQVDIRDSAFVEHFDILAKQEGKRIHDVTFPNACFWFPDIKAQDQHFHPDFFKILYSVLQRDTVSKIPKIYQQIFSAYLGFMHQLEQQPLILTNANVLFQGRNLNVSGGPFTTIHSNNHSCVIKEEIFNWDWKIHSQNKIKLAHKAAGDDAMVMFYLPGSIHLGYSGILDRKRTTEQKLHNTITENNTHVQNRVLDFQFKNIIPFQKYILKKYGIELKDETLQLYPTLSAGEFLGNSIYYLPDDADGFGQPAFVASRPLSKVLFSGFWGQTIPSPGIGPHMVAAMRIFSAYYDSSLIYLNINTILAKVYYYLRNLEANKPLAPYKYFETDYFEMPPDMTVLPDLPKLADVFTWMTGLQSTSEEFKVEEGEEYASFEEHEELPKGKEIEKPLPLEETQFEEYEEVITKQSGES